MNELPPGLEERTVRRLRAEGLLRPPTTQRGRPTTGFGWATAAIAAGLALFSTGFLLGEQRGGQRTLDVVEALAEADASRTAAVIQRTGSDYVAALSALASADGADSQVGREIARAVLWSAAAELARMDPDDADLWRTLESLRPRASIPPDSSSTTAPHRTVVWF